ncbi:DUF747-domain-containing protein [Auricularia subglabra TFB-10046 SS5]|nr:DUF747-domain-containing protein [Auricularia subglabra TFB-10046 SS5]
MTLLTHRDRRASTSSVPERAQPPRPLPLLTRASQPVFARDDDDDSLTPTYASLPPSPISSTPPPPLFPPPPQQKEPQAQHAPFSLWDYLQEELLATDFDSHQEMKWERVSNFLAIPVAVEKIVLFGWVLCFDSFLYTFTIQPIRAAIAAGRLLLNALSPKAPPLPAAQKADILRALLLVLSVAILAPLTDASKIYHSIRGQDTIKLYVIFNALEIADRLFASFGQDIVDCLFSRSNLMLLSHHLPFSARTLKPLFFFVLSTLYTVGHALVLIYQLTALNVAINSYDHSLLTLLVSNQFVEIKGSVFKKFEKDNLFQITCADIVERFQLAVMLASIAFRNFIEVTGSTFDFSEGSILPKAFNWVQGRNIVWTIFSPVMTVLMSEIIVDWLKHAFITKFNHIRPSVYERYTDVLCRDLASGSALSRRRAQKHTYVDQSPLVARRLGFAALPMAVLAVILGGQSMHILFVGASVRGDALRTAQWAVLGILCWLCVVLLKILLGLQLVGFALTRQAGAAARVELDKINDFGRDPIGEGKEERQYNKDLKKLLNQPRDDMAPTAEIGEKAGEGKGDAMGAGGGAGGGKRRLELEELTRFTMVKRIW